MKKVALVLALLLGAVSVTPAAASEEVGLGPTGLLEAKKAGFDGSGFEFAVVNQNGFILKSSGVKRAVLSEACFAGDEEWQTKCKDGTTEQIGSGSSVDPDSTYSPGDSLIYSLAGSSKMIAPKSRAHAIRAFDLETTFPSVLEHAIAKQVSAVFFLERWQGARRGSEINCDSAFPEAAKMADQAKSLGIALISESGTGGDAYGLSFPSCLTAVLPVGNLDYFGEIAESVNAGPGLVLSHSRYESLDSGLIDGKEQLTDWDSVGKAMAVAGGIFAALTDAGFSPDVALQAIGQSNNTKDDVIVKGIPVINYLDARAWAQALAGGSVDLQIQSATKVGNKEVAFVLRGDPAALTTTQVIAYELFDHKTSKWNRTSVSAKNTRALQLSITGTAGWLRLLVSSGGKTQLTGPVAFSVGSNVKIDYTIAAPTPNDSVQEQAALPQAPQLERSVVEWPEVNDPALELLELDYAREMQITGKGVTVAIIDDGYQFDHPYLAGARVLDGLCLEMDESCPNGTNKQMGVEAAEPKYDEDSETRQDHGTMVAGTIGGTPHEEATGGIAPEVTFVVARVDLNGSDENGDYVNQALEWIYELSLEHNISSINMSFGYYRGQRDQLLNGTVCEDDSDFVSITNQLRERGIAPVVASGNDGLVEGIGGPACESPAIAIGATDNDGSVINYSNISTEVDLIAPARKTTSLGDGVFAEGSGTSNATPVVAGAFALVKQLRPELSVDEVLFAMQESADLVDDIYVKDLPRLNIRKLLEYLTPGSDFDGLRPTASVSALGLSCVVEFDSRDALQSDVRYRTQGSTTWSHIANVTSPFLIPDLTRETNYEIEIGALQERATLWSERQICTTGLGSAPDTISGATVEARGADWAIVHVPPVGRNGAALQHLNYQNAAGKTVKAIPLGANRYYFAAIDRGTSLLAAFENEFGSASYSSLELPAFTSQPFKASTLLNGFRTSALLAAHRTKLNKDLGSLTGVTTLTCTGYFAATASTSVKNTIKLRATNSCKEAKKLHPAAKVVVKTTSTRARNMIGAVGVVAVGVN
jgi:subtilisin family serine protease